MMGLCFLTLDGPQTRAPGVAGDAEEAARRGVVQDQGRASLARAIPRRKDSAGGLFMSYIAMQMCLTIAIVNLLHWA